MLVDDGIDLAPRRGPERPAHRLDGRVVVTIYDRRRRVGHARQVVGRALQLAVRRRKLGPQHGVRVLGSSGLVS